MNLKITFVYSIGYLDVLECIESSASENIPYTGNNNNNKKNRKPIPGWSEMVEPFKQDARFWYQLWLSAGKPSDGDLFQNMRKSRRVFKSAKRKCVNAGAALKRQNFIEASLSGDKDLFKELKKMRGTSNTTSTKVDGAANPEDIADKFQGIYTIVIIKQFNERPVLQNEIPRDLTDDDWKALLAKADKDNNGKISIEEYKANGASSLTVTTVWLGLVSAVWLSW